MLKGMKLTKLRRWAVTDTDRFIWRHIGFLLFCLLAIWLTVKSIHKDVKCIMNIKCIMHELYIFCIIIFLYLSCSVLRLTKTYQSSTMGHSFLLPPSLLSIESKLMRSILVDDMERKGKEGKEGGANHPYLQPLGRITKDADQRGRVEGILKATLEATIWAILDHGVQLWCKGWFYRGCFDFHFNILVRMISSFAMKKIHRVKL